MKLFFTVAFLFILSGNLCFSQVDLGRKFNAFSGTMVLSVEGGATYPYTDYNSPVFDFLTRGTIEYFLPAYSESSFGFRLTGGSGYIKAEDNLQLIQKFRTRISFTGLGVVYLLSVKEVFFPYISAGANYVWFDPRGQGNVKLPNNQSGLYKKNEINYGGEIGFRVKITDNLSFNMNGGIQLSPNDYLDDIALGTDNDAYLVLGAGLSYSFFGDKDSDGDGVVDRLDRCPNTPKGVKVDEFGCPLDSDGDGVPDYLDKCPNTPPNVKVDSDGCPLDSDGDGVPDYMDICPDTPRGIEVDEFGCPYDRDADGVPDYLDKCPDTPYNAAVDEHGCPLDSDGDGVPDYLDKCPDTPQGIAVDEFGCPVADEEEVSEVILGSSTTFAFNSFQLQPAAYPVLDKLVDAMKKNPLSRWRIEGHTDNIGSDEGNRKISLQRAQAVLEYFVANGINRARFEVVGLGKSFPIANNATEEGRSQNRRVVIIKIN